MHHGTCVTHVPWYMSGSITRGGGENVPGIPGACATRNFYVSGKRSLANIVWKALHIFPQMCYSLIARMTYYGYFLWKNCGQQGLLLTESVSSAVQPNFIFMIQQCFKTGQSSIWLVLKANIQWTVALVPVVKMKYVQFSACCCHGLLWKTNEHDYIVIGIIVEW